MACLYKAEALVALDQIADAIAHLSPDNVTDISLTLPENKLDQGTASCYSLLLCSLPVLPLCNSQSSQPFCFQKKEIKMVTKKAKKQVRLEVGIRGTREAVLTHFSC